MKQKVHYQYCNKCLGCGEGVHSNSFRKASSEPPAQALVETDSAFWKDRSTCCLLCIVFNPRKVFNLFCYKYNLMRYSVIHNSYLTPLFTVGKLRFLSSLGKLSMICRIDLNIRQIIDSLIHIFNIIHNCFILDLLRWFIDIP